MPQEKTFYIWFDAEFTDLDPGKSHLLQVAAIVTDTNLRRLHTPEDDLCLTVRLSETAPVSEWVQKHLSTLVERSRYGDEALQPEQVDDLLTQRISVLMGGIPEAMSNRPILAGNSIHADRAVIRARLPLFERCLHYRMLDVSVLKLLWKDWRQGVEFDKSDSALVRRWFSGDAREATQHDALYDVRASIAELAYYRAAWLNPDGATG